jgi:hypothetical protein
MVQVYWNSCHLIMFMSLLFLVSLRRFLPYKNIAKSAISTFAASEHNTLSKVLIGLAIAQCAFYLWIPNFTDYGEATIPLLAGNILHNAPVYADWNRGQMIVGSNYGPYVFLAQIPVLLWSPEIFGSKLVGIVFGLTGLSLLFFAVRPRVRSTNNALAIVALMVALLSSELHYWFWNRPDSFLIALVSLGTLIFERSNPTVCLASLGLLAGLAVNLKLFGALYLIPLALACVPMVPSWASLAGAFAFGGALFGTAIILPFRMESFSAETYIANLSMMPNQGFNMPAAFDSVGYGMVILAFPFLAFRTKMASRNDQLLLVSAVICTVLVALISGKPGGGSPYMMPLIPLALYVGARQLSRAAPEQSSEIFLNKNLVLWAVLIFSAPIWAFSWYQMAKQIPNIGTDQAKAKELRSIFRTFPGSEMGDNSGETRAEEYQIILDENLRVEKAFLHQITRFDYVNYADQRFAGLSGSVLYPLLQNCRIPTWVLPRQGGRFRGGMYGLPILDKGGLERFHANYELIKKYQFYEVWRCKKQSNPPVLSHIAPKAKG